MTLDSSSPANAATAAKGPQYDSGRTSEAPHERPDLGALEALLADPAAVSSEETAPAGFIAEPLGRDEAGAGAIGPFQSRAGSLADLTPESSTHAPNAPGEIVRTVDDGFVAQPSAPAELPTVPMEHDTYRAETATRDELAGSTSGEDDSSSASEAADDPPGAPAAGDTIERNASAEDTSAGDTSAGDTSAGDTSAGDTSVEDTSVMALHGAVRPETDAESSVNEHRDRSDRAGANGPDRVTTVMATETAESLGDALLRDIADSPAISSDSIALDEADTASLALDPPDQDSDSAAGADGAPTPSRTVASTDEVGGMAGDAAGLADRLDKTESSVALAARERLEERSDLSPAALSLFESDAPGVGSSSAPPEIDDPPVAPATNGTDIDDGGAVGSNASDGNVRGPAEPVVPAVSAAHERLEPGEEAASGRPKRSSNASGNADGALLDDMLLRGIAGSPAISSDFASSDQSGAAALAVDFTGHASGSAASDGAEPVARAPEHSGPPPAEAGAGLDESALGRIAGEAAASASEPDGPSEPDSRETGAAMSCDVPGEPVPGESVSGEPASCAPVSDVSVPSVPDRSDPVASDVASLEDSDRIGLPETEDAGEESAPVAHERRKGHSDSPAEALSAVRPAVPETESSFDPAVPDEPAIAATTEDTGARDVESESGADPVIHLPDLSGSLPSGTGAGQTESLLRQIADVVTASAGEAPGPKLPGSGGSASVAEQDDRGDSDAPRSEESIAIALSGPEASEWRRRPAPIVPERPQGPTDSLRKTLPASAEAAAEAPGDRTAPDESTIASTTDDAGEAEAAPAASESESPRDPAEPVESAVATFVKHTIAAETEIEDGASSVIHLPELNGLAPLGTGADQAEPVVSPAADAVPISSSESAVLFEAALPMLEDTQADGFAGDPRADDGSAADDVSPGYAGVVSLPESDGVAEPAASVEGQSDDDRQEPEAAQDDRGKADADAVGIVFDDTLLLDLAAVAPVSSDEDAVPDPAFDVSLPHADSALPDDTGTESDPDYADIALEAASPGPAAALAFATDAETEVALRDGLFGFGSASAGTGEPQVWQGGLRAAIAALAEGHTAPLVIVDIDGVSYPAGAIHELAAVCEVGTVVVAVGSDVSARPGRELLLSGVSDYLAKPLTAEAVRGVARRALADAAGSRPGGRVACFIGCGGSGATTLVAATALHAASRGCYVSVLDLSRSVAAAALALGVEPVAGLDQLLETADKVEVEPESLEGVCGRRSDRIEVYAHRWSPEHPAAATPAGVDRILAALRQRSQLVLVDGLDEIETRFFPCVEADMQVFVAEPTAGKTPHLARMINRLDGDRPLVFVQNHTRTFRRDAGTRALREAGTGIEPDVTVPFDASVPETADRGWPQGTLPRSIRKPVAALTGRLLEASSSTGASAALARAA